MTDSSADHAAVIVVGENLQAGTRLGEVPVSRVGEVVRQRAPVQWFPPGPRDVQSSTSFSRSFACIASVMASIVGSVT